MQEGLDLGNHNIRSTFISKAPGKFSADVEVEEQRDLDGELSFPAPDLSDIDTDSLASSGVLDLEGSRSSPLPILSILIV